MDSWLNELRPYPGEGRWGSGWRLAKSGARLLRRDRTLRKLVLLEAALSAIVLCGGLVVDDFSLALDDGHLGPHLLANALIAFGSTFLAFAMASTADAAIDGQAMDLDEALADARTCLGAVLVWGLISFAISVGFWLLEDVSSLLASLLVIAWVVASFFVIPAMALEHVRPAAALAESVRTVRRRWRQLLAGAIGVVFFFAMAVLFLTGAMFEHVAAVHAAGHGTDHALLIVALLLTALVTAVMVGALVIFALILLRESLDDLPGTAYAGPHLRRRTKALRFAGGFVVIVACFAVVSALTTTDRKIVKAHSAPGANYEIIVANPGSLELKSGAGVYYREVEIGTVLGSEPEGANLRIDFHVDPGYGPAQTPGAFTIAGSGGGCPCLVLIPGPDTTGPDLQQS